MKLIRQPIASTAAPAIAALVILLVPGMGHGQEPPPTFRQLFESGQYQEMANRAASQGDTPLDPADAYLVAHAYQKLQNLDAARATLAQLSARGETDTWSLVARSEQARLDKNLDQALSLAQTAVGQATAPEAPPGVSTYAYYQLGAVSAQRQDMAGAAQAFEQSSTADPNFAYAHYYAGLAYSRLQQIDRSASHLEAFLTLAPLAPERGAVESIMRTIRGR